MTPARDPQRKAAVSAARVVDPATAREVLDEADIARALTRIAHEILERNKGAREVVLLGIPSRGVELARRIGDRIAAVESGFGGVGALDVTMYRDDLRLRPTRALGHTEIPDGGIDGQIVVLVDDVLFSGRTIRAALTALDDLGRPRAVQLAVLVDRGHRELPIRADFVGKNLPTSAQERVTVQLRESDARETVVIDSTPPIRRLRGRTQRAGTRQRGRRHRETPVVGRRSRQGRGAPGPRHRREAPRTRRPSDQEAADAAGPDRRQPVLRGLDAHPDLVRGGREATLRGRDQLLGEGLERREGREPQGHRPHPGSDGCRRRGRPPRSERRAAPARDVRLDPQLRGQRRRRHPRASDASAP